MAKQLSLAVLAIALSACAGQQQCGSESMPAKELIPVPVARRPPAWLAQRAPAPAPTLFVAPCDPKIKYEWGVCNASSALTPEGETELRRWVDDLHNNLDAWREWATDSEGK